MSAGFIENESCVRSQLAAKRGCQVCQLFQPWLRRLSEDRSSVVVRDLCAVGTPDAIVSKIQNAVRTVMSDPFSSRNMSKVSDTH